LTQLLHTAEALVAQYGLLALFVSVSLEAVGAPLPGETAIMLAAGAASAGELNVYAVALTAFLAAVLGDNVGYLLGRRLGRPVILRYGARVGLGERTFAHAEAVARRHGPLMVVFARFVVLLRQLNGLVAGTTGMPWPVFLAANAVGAALWVGVWTSLAYHFGKSIDIIPLLWHHLGLTAGIAITILIAVLVWLRFFRRPGPDAAAGPGQGKA
jgi:membrane protein DedA with SNARE-associated domain